MSLTDYALTTYRNAKNALNDDALTPAQVERLINAATDAIEAHLGRRIMARNYAEWLDGQGGSRLFLKHHPVVSISKIVIGRTDGEELDPDDYVVDMGAGIVQYDYGFTAGWQNILVEYRAGSETIPADVEQVCIELVCLMHKQAERNGIKSEKLGDYSYEMAEGDAMRNLLNQRLAGWRVFSI